MRSFFQRVLIWKRSKLHYETQFYCEKESESDKSFKVIIHHFHFFLYINHRTPNGSKELRKFQGKFLILDYLLKSYMGEINVLFFAMIIFKSYLFVFFNIFWKT